MDIAARISVTCFAASYLVSLLFEVARVFWQRRWMRWVATGGALAGIAAQTLYLLHRTAVGGGLPISTQFESLIFVSWLISLVYLYLLIRDRRIAAGLFILPMSLGLVLFAGTLSDRGVREPDRELRFVATAHGMLLLLGTVMVVWALVIALMYLVKVRQLRTGQVRPPVRLPSLERLDRVNTLAVWMAWAFLTLGFVLGLILQSTSLALAWYDLKVVSTWVSWTLFTILAHFRYHPENRGRKVAILTVIACLFVLIAVLGDPIFGTGHQALPEVAP